MAVNGLAPGTVSAGVDADAYREALSSFASGVTLVTTRDATGRAWGFTASAFSALSVDPPLVLVCIDRRANCYPAFMQARSFAIQIMQPEHEAAARRFASKVDDKFGDLPFVNGPLDLPVLSRALAVLACRRMRRQTVGDHTILIGQVEVASVQKGSPMVYYQRRFWSLDRESDHAAPMLLGW
jgi:flavin reductase ActVB